MSLGARRGVHPRAGGVLLRLLPCHQVHPRASGAASSFCVPLCSPWGSSPRAGWRGGGSSSLSSWSVHPRARGRPRWSGPAASRVHAGTRPDGRRRRAGRAGRRRTHPRRLGGGRGAGRQHAGDLSVAVEPVPELVRGTRRRRSPRRRRGAGGRFPRRAGRDPQAVDGAGLGGGDRGRGALDRADPTKTPLVPDTTRCGPRRPGPRPSRRE